MIVDLTGSDFAKNLAAARKKRGLSQKALAKQAGMGVYDLRNIERGIAYPILEYGVLCRLCAALRTSVEALTEDTSF